MSTYTERYIAAAIRSVPPKQQAEVGAELEASITDEIDARTGQGETRDAAERAVLTRLGDPDALGAAYVDRPLFLIGPRYYLTWRRLLRLLWIIVTPCVVAAVALGQTIAGEDLGVILGNVWIVGLSAVVHIGFWTTVVFAILDRTTRDVVEPWTLDQLSEAPVTSSMRSATITTLVFLLLATAAILWEGLVGFIHVDGVVYPVFNLELWPWWIAALLVAIAADAALTIVAAVRARYTVAYAACNTALALAVAVPAIVLLSHERLLNPALVEFGIREGAGADIGRTVSIVVAFAVAALALWDIIDGWRKAWADRSTGPSAAFDGVGPATGVARRTDRG